MPSPKSRSRLSPIGRTSLAPFRAEQGSILPLVTIAMMVVVAYTGFAVDVMRTMLTVRKLQFAAQSAALYAYSYATNPDGSYSPSKAQANISSRIASAGGSTDNWNSAPAGPSGNSWHAGVTFDTSDISFVNNPGDNSEFFLQLKARRDGWNALKMFFLPAVYAMDVLSGSGVPPGAYSIKPYRVAEVVGQPAARIGAGAPRNAAAGTREADLEGFAVLPIAVSNQQFKDAVSPSQSQVSYAVDMVDSNTPAGAVSNGHFRGALVNVAATGDSTQYYGGSQGDVPIDELLRTFSYFSNAPAPDALPPAAVERGVKLGAFDPADPKFQQRKQEILASLLQLPLNRIYLVPVLKNDPDFALRNEVVGFARLKLIQSLNSAGSDFALVLELTESVPVRNATCAAGVATIPATFLNVMPPPVAPFVERQWITDTGALSTRPRGIALAPAVSPRLIPQVN